MALARALLLNPPILLLDDATASVDAQTEHEIQKAIANALRGRTTVLVSNRISTLRRADRIVMLSRGRIVECGSHAELMAANGPYRRLAELQFADLMDDNSAAQNSNKIDDQAEDEQLASGEHARAASEISA